MSIYWYNWTFEYILYQIKMNDLCWYYFFSTIFVMIVIWRIYSEWTKFAKINTEAVSTIVLLFMTFFVYLNLSHIFILVFLLECQGIIFLYFITQNQNTFKFKKIVKSILNSAQKSRIWRTNALFIQFWTNFFGALLLIMCTSQLVNIFGSLNWLDLEYFAYFNFVVQSFKQSKLCWIFSLLIGGFLLKVGLIPFHFWKPELYRNFSYLNMFIYASIYVFAFTFLFIIIIYANNFFINKISIKIIWFLIIISIYILIGLLFYITEIKIFLAYTSVAHLTYIFAASLISKGQYEKMLFYIFIYMIITISVFIVILSFKNMSLQYLSDLQILTHLPYMLFQFIVAIAAMAGLPPLLGFWAKILIVISLWNSAEYSLALHILSCGLILMYFYFQNYRFTYTVNTKINIHAIQIIPSNYILNFSILMLVINLSGYLFINDLLAWTFLSII